MNQRADETKLRPAKDRPKPRPGHVDVLVVGAGISGVGAAYHLSQQCPDKRFVILESKDSFGGTWITHRYPGIRSDSDLFTFGYRFKPWRGAPIATAEEILGYMNEVIDENDIDQHIHYGQQILAARWSSVDKHWQLDVIDRHSSETYQVTAGFLWMCQGYYAHDQGYTPQWDGMDDFAGEIVHPQTWPESLEYQGKRVIVIGSGATAATLIPAMAGTAEHVTMLQRSPTFFVTGRNANELADTLRELDIDDAWIHEIVRRKILFDQDALTRRAFTDPEGLKTDLLAAVRAHLGPDFDVEKHFTPRYLPWRQRIAFIPDGDLFKVVREGKASVVTDEIERFTRKGILLKSGEELAADIIVTATGFNLNVMGDITFSIDGKPVDFSQTVAYRGTMFVGVPNLAWVFGYFRASWTLRADLIGDFVCKLLTKMAAEHADTVTPALRAGEGSMTLKPWIEPENFNPGYISRSLHLLPKQGDRQPWLHMQNYWAEKDELPVADLDDGALKFE